MTAVNEDQWIGTLEAAESLDVDPRDIYRLVDDGKLTGARRGSELVVDRADVDGYETPDPAPLLSPGGESNS